jgi:Cu(I)/Ag(I) efflux system membrane fusion protein
MSKLAIGVAAIAALAAAGYGGYRLAQHREMSAAATANVRQTGGGATQDGSGRQVLYWYDPMRPEQKFDKPGKSPFMDMQLVPKYAGEAEAGVVSISPQMVQNLGVRTAEAKRGALEQRFEAVGAVAFNERGMVQNLGVRTAQAKTGPLEQRFEAVGSVAYNERGVVQLQARAAGFVEKLHARAPLDPVRKGAPLVEILYPEWAGAQEEYLLLRKSGAAELQALASAARRRLALLGMGEAEIAALEREGKVRARATLYSPVNGVIAELGVREGMTVMPGSALFRLVDLSTVWVNAEVPEAQAGWLRPGSRVQARVAAYPESVFEGRVGALLPEVSSATRTLRARIELANPGLRLKPGMFATLAFAGRRGKDAVLVPSEAVIRTGSRDVVVLALGGGRFRAAQVELGAESGGQSEIRKGLQAGDSVVLSGQFLIDSEASLSAAASRLAGPDEAPAKPQWHRATGRVLSVDPASGYIELEHDPIASLQWPSMTMGFLAQDKAGLQGLKPGDRVQFELRGAPDKDGNYLISKIGK